MKKLSCFISGILAFFSFAIPAYAHEAYVLPRNEFYQGLQTSSHHPFSALFDPAYINMFLVLIAMLAGLYLLYFFWSVTRWAMLLDRRMYKSQQIIPILLRMAIGVACLSAAATNTIFGPELSLAYIPGGEIVRWLLFFIGIMNIVGFYVYIMSIMGMGIFLYMGVYDGFYMATYLSYVGGFLFLVLLPSQHFSLDNYLPYTKKWVHEMKKYKAVAFPLLRISFGLALLYTGYTVKFQHQALPIMVYYEYHLNTIFPAPAAFVAAAAGVVECFIGLCILFGFAVRLTSLLLLITLLLAQFYFREILWPHLILYALSLSLFINPDDRFSIDRGLVMTIRMMKGK